MALEPNEPVAAAEVDAADAEEFYVPELPANYIIDDTLIEDNRIGQLLLRHRIVSIEQLESALDTQMRNPGSLLGELIVETGVVSQEDIQHVLRLQLEELRLGQILERTQCISQDQLQIALNEQESTGELLGSTLISLGFCTPEQIAWALDQQKKD